MSKDPIKLTMTVGANEISLSLTTAEARTLIDQLREASTLGGKPVALNKQLAALLVKGGEDGGRCHNWQHLADNEHDAPWTV